MTQECYIVITVKYLYKVSFFWGGGVAVGLDHEVTKVLKGGSLEVKSVGLRVIVK